MRYRFIAENSKSFPVEKMCRVLKVGRSSYYDWLHRAPSRREQFHALLIVGIRQIHWASKGRYGSPRIAKELNIGGIKVSKCVVANLMRREGIRSIVRQRYKVTTDSKHSYPVVENRLMRNFNVGEKNSVWVSDITYIATMEGWAYLTTVIDLADRKVVGWSLGESMRARDTVIPAWRMAVLNRPIEVGKELVFHSDRGVQYACNEFADELGLYANVRRSMSRKGNCWDNAVAESFFKTLKVELVYHNKYQTRQEAALSIFEYIETWYNRNRRHKTLNNLTILEHEKLHLRHAA